MSIKTLYYSNLTETFGLLKLSSSNIIIIDTLNTSVVGSYLVKVYGNFTNYPGSYTSTSFYFYVVDPCTSNVISSPTFAN